VLAVGETEQLPLLHTVSVVQPAVLLASLATHWPALQYCALQAVGCAVPQAPAPLQVEVILAVKSAEQLDGQAASFPGNTQSGCAPSHFMVPQVPEPPQEVRGAVTALQTPGVCLQDWHCPVQALLQQTPSATRPLVHS
jgi:hypothetical protein